MSKSNVVVQLLLRALLVGAAVLGLFSAAHAQGRIGVTQATQNNPMGKPPGGLDRVLRVGTDVQANEIISTAADDRAHLVFLDGTTLTVGTQFPTHDRQVRLRSDDREGRAGGQRHQGRVPCHRRQDQQDIGDHRHDTVGNDGYSRRHHGLWRPGVGHDLDLRLWQQHDGDRQRRDPDGDCAGLVGEHPTGGTRARRRSPCRATSPRRWPASRATRRRPQRRSPRSKRSSPTTSATQSRCRPSSRRSSLRIRLHRSPRPPPRPRCPS